MWSWRRLPHTHRAGCLRWLAQPDGGREPPIHVLRIGFAGVRHGNCGHLVHDRIRPGLGHRLTDRRRIQSVHHDAVRAQLRQQAQLVRARRRSRHLVAPGHELRHQPPPQDPLPPATNTRMTITLLISDLRRDSPAVRDMGG